MRKLFNLKNVIVSLVVCASCLGFSYTADTVKAENPFVQTMYTADPAPLIVGDTIYVYTTRDEKNDANSDEWSLMNEWRCFSSKDMVNWTDHGQILHAESFDGKDNWRAWAPQCVSCPVKENGEWKTKYFFFACFNGTKIDVAVADNPWGPFEDATPGKYLIDGGWGGGNIDPTVYIEDHGNPDDYENYDIYMYWGNPYLRYCKLTNDLLDVELDTNDDGVISEEENSLDPRFTNEDNKILGQVRPGLHSFATNGDEGIASFGVPTQGKDSVQKYPAEPEGSELPRSGFEEGPWLFKHEDGNPETDDYFLMWVGGRTPGETVQYSTAPTPVGPWTYQALLMKRENGFSCIHPGVAVYKGVNYLFYLNEMLVRGDGSNRSVCVKTFEYDENNLIKRETPESEENLMIQGLPNKPVKGESFYSVDPVGTLNPYELNQAETICWESNLNGPEGGLYGTGAGVNTMAKFPYEEIDPVTGKVAFWQSAAYNGVVVCDISKDDFIKVREVDFGTEGAKSFTANVACGDELVGGNIELWLDYEDYDKATCIGMLEVKNTGGDNEYKDITIDIADKITGVHDLYFIFTGEGGQETNLFNFDTWQFESYSVPATQAPVQTQAPVVTPTAVPTAVPTAQPQPTPVADKKVSDKPVIKSIKKEKGKLVVTIKNYKKKQKVEVYVSLKKNGKYKKVATFKKATGKVSKLKKGKKYYVKVRINKKYSAVKKIKM